ncbi:DUF2490 domain-containing protein [Flammeovirga sp. SubArs3]|uniref:DUF2490 domain-containing protein n=1 Tax=Flammeovirga sp. SubArs3 TaxID=2995316 RepID=UPI00248C06E6|nr:DUF2490 domain-containing protein [Flammeovirga sp. SubArs3]
MKKVLITLILILGSITIYAQNDGQWGGLYLKARISDKLGYYGEHHIRYTDEGNGFYLHKSYNRMGLNYFVNDHFDIVVGPAIIGKFNQDTGYGEQDPYDQTTLMEYRIWHQYLYHHYIGRAKIYHQVRIEHRWEDKVGYTKYSNRYRYKLYAYIPINNKHMSPGTFFVSPSVELFMQDNHTHSLEDLRIYNAIGYKFNETTSFTAGHMWTYNQTATSNVFRFSLYIDFDLRK